MHQSPVSAITLSAIAAFIALLGFTPWLRPDAAHAHPPVPTQSPATAQAHLANHAHEWIDLGDEDATLWLSAHLRTPRQRSFCELSLTTSDDQSRVRLRINDQGQAVLWVYDHAERAQFCKPEETMTLIMKIVSHRGKPDVVMVTSLSADNSLPTEEPNNWSLVNRGGDSNANLAKIVFSPHQARDHISQLRIATTWNELQRAAVLDYRIQTGPPASNLLPSDPVSNPEGGLMLDLPDSGTDIQAVDYDRLPDLSCQQSVISMGTSQWHFRLHNYLAWYGGRFWCIWSHGTDIEELPAQHIRYSTSADGLHWSRPEVLVGPPADPAFGYIARGLWLRNGKLIALAARFKAPGFAGEGLSLHGFYWNETKQIWQHAAMIRDDSMNNFAPQLLPDGNWMMTRRAGSRDVSVMIGGIESLNQWDVHPLASYTHGHKTLPEEPCWYVLPDGKNIVGLFRNNSGHDLLRAFSTDNGRTWSSLVHTNFPDARSKFNVLRTSRHYYVMVSNANPQYRNPLCLSLSLDGLVYVRMGRLNISDSVEPPDWDLSSRYGNDRGQRPTYQYPHVIEHDGTLYIAFSRRKQSIEVLRISLDDVETTLQL